jgi:hypothetical protein
VKIIFFNLDVPGPFLIACPTPAREASSGSVPLTYRPNNNEAIRDNKSRQGAKFGTILFVSIKYKGKSPLKKKKFEQRVDAHFQMFIIRTRTDNKSRQGTYKLLEDHFSRKNQSTL